MTETPSAGRRAATSLRRRIGALEVVAIALPLVTVGALSLVQPVEDPATTQPPTEAALVRATAVCPPAADDARTVAISHADGGVGQVEITVPEEDTLDLSGTVRRGKDNSVVIAASGELASGLITSRYGGGAGVSCGAPAPDQWFTGVGAAPEHTSTLVLVNPDKGPAVADVTVLGPAGPVDVPALRGVRVPGGQTATFDLDAVLPTREELALNVHVSRGRLGAHLLDRVDELGRGDQDSDWLPAQAEPAEVAHLLGLGGTRGDRILTVANPSPDEARVQVKLVTQDSEFSPSGAEEIRVAPQSAATVDLSRLLGTRAANGAVGLRIDASTPVTSTLRTFAEGELSHAVGGALLAERGAMVVPEGTARLVLAGSTAVGVATYVARDETGAELSSERVELNPGQAVRLKLPARTSVVEVEMSRTEAVGAIEVSGPGFTVLPLVRLVEHADVPDVRPALR